MSTPLLNSFILTCKIMTCICILVASFTHHWVRVDGGRRYAGMVAQCFDYGSLCYRRNAFHPILWFFNGINLLNILLESLNILLLYKRRRSRINLVLEELGLVTTVVFLAPSLIFCIIAFGLTRGFTGETLDWSFYVAFLSTALGIIEFICSLVRAVSYCRENSFRSNVITYTTTNDDQTVHIQT